MSKEHTYSNGEVTIVWKSELCIHSKNCWKGLEEVFRPGERPWIKPDGASTERIVDQVSKCPSGALSIRRNAEEHRATEPAPNSLTVQVSPNGPLLVKDRCVITHADGRTEIREQATALCRCGASANKPYCDGSHRKIDFQG